MTRRLENAARALQKALVQAKPGKFEWGFGEPERSPKIGGPRQLGTGVPVQLEILEDTVYISQGSHVEPLGDLKELRQNPAILKEKLREIKAKKETTQPINKPNLSYQLITMREQPTAQVEEIKKLCGGDPSIISSTEEQITLLCEALDQGYEPEVILELLAQGADPNIVSYTNWETLATALNHQYESEVILALIKAGADKQNNESHHFCGTSTSVLELARLKGYEPAIVDGYNTYVLNEQVTPRPRGEKLKIDSHKDYSPEEQHRYLESSNN